MRTVSAHQTGRVRTQRDGRMRHDAGKFVGRRARSARPAEQPCSRESNGFASDATVRRTEGDTSSGSSTLASNMSSQCSPSALRLIFFRGCFRSRTTADPQTRAENRVLKSKAGSIVRTRRRARSHSSMRPFTMNTTGWAQAANRMSANAGSNSGRRCPLRLALRKPGIETLAGCPGARGGSRGTAPDPSASPERAPYPGSPSRTKAPQCMGCA